MSTVSGTAILNQAFDPVARCLTPEAARRLTALRADPAAQKRIDELADKCTTGQITSDERDEYAFYIAANHVIAILQMKARTLLGDCASISDYKNPGPDSNP